MDFSQQQQLAMPYTEDNKKTKPIKKAKSSTIISPKYSWKIGSRIPTLDQHSKVKHTIIEDYIQRYIETVMSQVNIPAMRLTIIDGFCGGGGYIGESGNLVDGSPVIVMKAVKAARLALNVNREKERFIDARYIFIDILKDNTDYLDYILKSKLDEKKISPEDFAKCQIINNDFTAELPKTIEKIKIAQGGERAIFILDQYSYKDVPLQPIASLMKQVNKAEVILTFNIDNLITYISDRASNRKAISNINLDKYIPWDRISEIKLQKEWRTLIQRCLAKGIKAESGAKYMTLFFVKPYGENSWGYWLIHLSNHYRAHDVMKGLHWEHGNEFGHELEPGIFTLGYDTNKDTIYTGQDSFVFDDNLKAKCINDIHENFGQHVFYLKKPIRISELFESFISQSTAAERHMQVAMKNLHASKNVVISTEAGSLRKPSKHYNRNDVVEARPQVNIKLF